MATVGLSLSGILSLRQSPGLLRGREEWSGRTGRALVSFGLDCPMKGPLRFLQEERMMQRRRLLVSAKTNCRHCASFDTAALGFGPNRDTPRLTPTRFSTFCATTIPFERSESSEEKEPLQT